MSWTTAGVQSGTDTDLSGITTVTSTTSITAGTGVNQRSIYRVVAATLTINGTLTINPEQEELLMTVGVIVVGNGGTLNIGSSITLSSITRYPYGTVIHFATGEGWSNTNLRVNSGGTFNWYGGIIFTGGGSMIFDSGSTVELFSKQCVFIRSRDAANAEAQIRVETDNYDQAGLTDIGYNDVEDWLSWLGFWNTFEGYQPIHKRSAMSGSSSSSANKYLNEGYDGSLTPLDDSLFWNNRQMEFKNSATGSDLTFTGLNASSASNRGVYMVTSDLDVTLLDDSQSGIVGGMYFIRDYDNGDRKDDTITGDLHDFETDRTYTKTSSTGGVCTTTNVLTMSVVRDSGTAKGTADVGDNKYDYRSKNDDNTDVFDIGIHAYGYLKVASSNIALKGIGGVNYSRTLLDDPNITQSTQSTVAGYTTIDNLNELYDYGSYWHLDDSGGLNIEIPSLGAFLIPCAGAILELGAKDLVVNTGASDAFDFTTNTITIKPTTVLAASNIKTTIQTTGDITFTTASIGSDLVLDADVYLNAAQSLTDVKVTGDLHINTGADSILTFSGVIVTGNVYNDDTAHTLQILSTNGSSLTAGDSGTGDGQTDVVQSVDIKVIVKDIVSNDLIEGARVLIKADTGGDLPAEDSVSITRVSTTATVVHTAHGLVDGEYIIIAGADQEEYIGTHQITYISANSYSYTVSGTPATPATGTITATARLVNELTDVDGEVNKIHRYTNAQPVVGVVRKATP